MSLSRKSARKSFLGVGCLYQEEFAAGLARDTSCDFVEVITENLFGTKGSRKSFEPSPGLRRVIDRYPLTLHGVSLSIGSADALDSDYLRQLKRVVDWIRPICISDHLVWCGVDGRNFHELIPLPYTKETIRHVVRRIDRVQNLLGRPMAFENSPNYVSFRHSEMSEIEFIGEVIQKSGCQMLLDLNNLHINSRNNDFDPFRYLDQLPLKSVAEVHIAGFAESRGFLIDSHDDRADDQVWELYRYLNRAAQPINTVIEWDHRIPTYRTVQNEIKKARSIQTSHRPTASPKSGRRTYSSKPARAAERSARETAGGR